MGERETDSERHPFPADRPLGLILQVKLEYDIEGERAVEGSPCEAWETLGFIFEAGRSLSELQDDIEAGIKGAGAGKMEQDAGWWGHVQVGGANRAVARVRLISGHRPEFKSPAKAEQALTPRAMAIGLSVARAAKALEWRRAGDEPGTQASMQECLKMLFEEFDALAEADALGRSVARPKARSVKSASL